MLFPSTSIPRDLCVATSCRGDDPSVRKLIDRWRGNPERPQRDVEYELIGDTRSYLRSRQRTPHTVANYFEEKQVSYAKAA
jgi:hypothetical protein